MADIVQQWKDLWVGAWEMAQRKHATQVVVVVVVVEKEKKKHGCD